MLPIEDPNHVTVDLAALARNFDQLRRLTPEGVRIMGVVKSDAYGHGAVRVAETLVEHGVDYLGVARLTEAVALRSSGVRAPVAVLSGFHERDEALTAVRNGITPVLFEARTVRLLSEESERAGIVSDYFIKVDTGMGRLGIPAERVAEFTGEVKNLPWLNILGIMSHLSSADEEDERFTLEQIRRFDAAAAALRSTGVEAPMNSLSNSAGLGRYRQASYGMVRTGIMLYGAKPSLRFKPATVLEPAMSFSSRVIQVREMPPAVPVSYGRTYYTRGPERLAVISAGYAEGLPRSMSNKGFVLVGERRAPLVGTICMNLTVCDITGIHGVEAGDEAFFLGSQGDSTITADDIAAWAGCISYDVLCSIGMRNKRVYLK